MEKNIELIEQQERELIQASILKRDLLKLFSNYKSSRKGPISFLFRNRNLTREKLQLVDETMHFISSYEGTKENFIEGLRRKRVENAEKSRIYGKFHFNLLAPHPQKENIDPAKKAASVGESSHFSGLATLFHHAINMATDRITAPISNSLNKHTT